MKRYISIMLITFLFLTTTLGSMSVFADTEIDETAPVIKSIEFLNGDQLDATKEPLKIKIDIIENGTGVDTIYFTFGKYDVDWYASRNGSELLFTGEHIIELDVSQQLPEGEQKLDYLTIGDVSRNSSGYDADQLKKVYGKSPSISIENSDWVDTEVKLREIRFLNPTNLDREDTLLVELTFETKGYIHGMYMNFYDPVSNENDGSLHYNFDGKILTSGTHLLEIPIDNNLKKGTLALNGIGFNGSTHTYYDDWSYPRLFEGKTIEITTGEDEVNLELLDYKIRETNLAPPALLEIVFDVDAHGKSFDKVQLGYRTEKGNSTLFYGDVIPQKDGTYLATCPVGPFITEGKLDLTYIYIYDTEGKYGTSYREHDSGELLKKGSITLESGYDITYFGSLGNSKVVSILKKMKSGETAVLDCRNKKIAAKTIFEAIAGRDITVAFIDEHVQWVFNGKNIQIDQCKDIDLTSEIEVVSGASLGFSDDQKIAKLIFKNNGELPGEVDMRINYDYLAVKYKFPKNNLTLSYHEPKTDNISIEDTDVDMAEDKYYEYEVDHNSTFILSKGRAKIGRTTVSVAQKNEDSIKIKWKKKAGNGYYIYRSTKKDGTYKKIATIKGNSTIAYKDDNVKAGKIYYYKVKPYSKNNTFNKTAVISKPCKACTKIIGKTSVTAVPNGLKSVKIKWKKTAGNGYYVYRATKKDGKYKKVATIKKNTTLTYVDKNVKKGKTYYYKVKPYSKKTTFNKTAKMSKPCKAYTRLKAPKIDTCRKVKNKLRVRIEWYGVKGAKYYEVYRSTKKNGTYKKVCTEKKTDTNYYIDKKVKKGKTYYYKIKAIYKKNSKYNSKLGAYKSVTVK